jgi:hypothetical protein
MLYNLLRQGFEQHPVQDAHIQEHHPRDAFLQNSNLESHQKMLLVEVAGSFGLRRHRRQAR